LIGALIVIFPIVWTLLSTIKHEGEIVGYPPTFLPKDVTFENYITAWTRINFATYFRNSIFIATVMPAIVCYTSAITGYVLAKLRFKGRGLIFFTIISTMMFPWPITIIPLYKMVMDFGWFNNYIALIVPFSFSAFGIFLMRQFCSNIPDDLIDAARIDGANEFRIFHQIVLPMLWPPISALTIFVFLGIWGDFLWPYLMISSDKLYTLQVGLNKFVGAYYPQTGPILAGATIAIVPVMVVYFIFQKRFIEGASLSGMKE